jgi:hypothetical protein
MCSRAWLYRLLAGMDLSELSAPADLVTKGARVLVSRAARCCCYAMDVFCILRKEHLNPTITSECNGFAGESFYVALSTP